MTQAPCDHVMIFESRVAGHHLRWLQYITEDLLAAGCRLTLAVDGRPSRRDHYRIGLGRLLDQVAILSFCDESGRPRGGSLTAALAHCLERSGADRAFVPNLDDIASGLWRRAAMGIQPPAILRGRLCGVYFRPRFLCRGWGGPGMWLKRWGFDRLVKRGWIESVFLLDETLYDRHRHHWPSLGLHWLPDPWEGRFDLSRHDACRQLGVPEAAMIWLNYGLGHRRKGLHLAVAAMAAAPDQPWHLLCAGQLQADRRLRADLAALEARGRATVLDRYVSENDERRVMCAADAVLLPYVRHFGSSGVLSLAAAARRPVVAADFGLVAHRVTTHGLGVTFTMGDADALAKAMADLTGMPTESRTRMADAGATYAAGCNRAAFGRALRAGLARRSGVGTQEGV